jgi:exonuclease SbcD
LRILHTSDWHLGRTLHGVDLLDHQRAFLDHLVALVAERQVDVVVVAGDVYDRAVPAVSTVTLLSETLGRLSDLATVVVTPGNHDSAVRLGFAAQLMRPGLHLLAALDRIAEPVVVHDESGPVAFYGIPYLDPDSARGVLARMARPAPVLVAAGAASEASASAASPAGLSSADETFSDDTFSDTEFAELQPDGSDFTEPRTLPRSHEAVVGAALDGIRADLAERPDHRSVVIAHAFVVGGAASESERDIRVGGVDSVPSEVFDGVDYVALGHLHGAQTVGSGSPTIRYSGSPLAFSFGEKNHVKSSALVDLDAEGGVSVELVPTPVPRRLAEITGSLDELLSGRFDDFSDAWVRVLVTDPAHPAHLHERVRERFPHALVIQHTPVGGPEVSRRTTITAETDPLEVAADFVAFATNAAPTAAESTVLGDAYERALAAERSA